MTVLPARAATVRYAVSFQNQLVATQTVTIVRTAERTRITTAFDAVLPAESGPLDYAEVLSATFRPDGTVEEFHARHTIHALSREVSGIPGEREGQIEVIRTDQDGTSLHVIRRDDYDFHSLILFGTPIRDYLPEHRPVRVLSIANGQVEPHDIRTMSQTETTRERQQVTTTRLAWQQDGVTTYSWHPDRPDHLPSRYIRETEQGRFSFILNQ